MMECKPEDGQDYKAHKRSFLHQTSWLFAKKILRKFLRFFAAEVVSNVLSSFLFTLQKQVGDKAGVRRCMER